MTIPIIVKIIIAFVMKDLRGMKEPGASRQRLVGVRFLHTLFFYVLCLQNFFCFFEYCTQGFPPVAAYEQTSRSGRGGFFRDHGSGERDATSPTTGECDAVAEGFRKVLTHGRHRAASSSRQHSNGHTTIVE